MSIEYPWNEVRANLWSNVRQFFTKDVAGEMMAVCSAAAVSNARRHDDQQIAALQRQLREAQTALEFEQTRSGGMYADIDRRNQQLSEQAMQLAEAQATIAQLREERDQEQHARLTEVEHWVSRYNGLDAWRMHQSVELVNAQTEIKQLRGQLEQAEAALRGEQAKV